MANRTALLMAIAVVLAALAAVKEAFTLSLADEPRDSKAARQRVAIVTQGVQDDPGSPVFELMPLQAGVSSATRARRSRALPDASRCAMGRGSS